MPTPPPSLITEVQQRVLDATTGEVSTPATPVPPPSTHLASPVAPPAATDEALAPFLAHNLLGGHGALRWRRQLARASRDQVLVLVGRQYGIFDIHELLVLLGVPLRHLPPRLGSAADILRRYGCAADP